MSRPTEAILRLGHKQRAECRKGRRCPYHMPKVGHAVHADAIHHWRRKQLTRHAQLDTHPVCAQKPSKENKGREGLLATATKRRSLLLQGAPNQKVFFWLTYLISISFVIVVREGMLVVILIIPLLLC